MDKEFAGLTAIITGGGSGIGLAVAKGLKERGATVFGFDINQGEMAPFATFIKCDIADAASVESAFAEFKKASNKLDILINNAGIGSLTTVEKESDENWHKVLNVNVVGTARVSRSAIPLLRESKSAAIVNTASIAGTDGVPNRAAYSASKGAVLALTLAMATDHLVDGIRVNAVNPATTDTPWVKRLLDQSPDAKAARSALEARQPMGRLVSPAEIASAIIFLASPLQSSVTGTTISIDGGMHSLRIPK
ncbi:D-threo-aldose 1-dehydrogenase [Candidatus Nanopelagicus hibericus]|uniref:D-threo-aldose 1-dehydrogenase n=1 Tax=Candidatus Nanopelagicus hibericus TaxID=1884915 RepID=A0A249K8L8_9ACTN|nr:SDR family oxidoreductase [Candidatus Nanopelagicus hibericus]ASY13056.1 D-threo-aldose 1-dehydrogenase [Candidatus Nanopelagicus hibericus]